jgi:hypothetical protein
VDGRTTIPLNIAVDEKIGWGFFFAPTKKISVFRIGLRRANCAPRGAPPANATGKYSASGASKGRDASINASESIHFARINTFTMQTVAQYRDSRSYHRVLSRESIPSRSLQPYGCRGFLPSFRGENAKHDKQILARPLIREAVNLTRSIPHYGGITIWIIKQANK